MNPEWESIVEADSEQEVHERFHEENTYGKYTDFQVQECIDSLTVADFEITEVKEITDERNKRYKGSAQGRERRP